ncbi:hypothetical protein P4H61_00480 [Paenibacillus peoriae]|nr:hypothetical protein [Paenibacillus peoriae]MEC0179976.1 hypothetical protein [Paenibacillus peoriae]
MIDGNVYKLLPDDLFQVAIEKLKLSSADKLGFEVNQARAFQGTET